MSGAISIEAGEPFRFTCVRLRSIVPPDTGILVGEGVRGDVLNLRPFDFRFGNGDSGGVPLKVAAAIKLLRSERELRRLFFNDLAFTSGGDAPIGLSLDCCACELEGRSSKAPRTVGLSRDTGRLFSDSIDFEGL